MVLTPSAMVPLGTQCPDFALPDTDGATVRLADFEGRPLLVMFLCNHCPYVKHIADQLAQVAASVQAKDIGVVGINSNDVDNYPEDSPERMAIEVTRRGYTFPYLFDGSQDVARAFDAQCTPDFFLFDAEHRLVYRGQFDDSRPGNGKSVTGASLSQAVGAVLAGSIPDEQTPSMGCNIKWK